MCQCSLCHVLHGTSQVGHIGALVLYGFVLARLHRQRTFFRSINLRREHSLQMLKHEKMSKRAPCYRDEGRSDKLYSAFKEMAMQPRSKDLQPTTDM